MSYTTVLEGLHERFATVSGLSSEAILDYEPTSIQRSPTLYSLLDSIAPTQKGQVKERRYRIMHRLCIKWQDNQYAERDLKAFVDAIPDAVLSDPQLGGRLTRGIAVIEEGTAGFVTIGGNLYRVLDFYSDVLDKSV